MRDTQAVVAPGKVSALVACVMAASCSSKAGNGLDAAHSDDAHANAAGDAGGDVGETPDVAPNPSHDAAVVPPDNVLFPDAPEAVCAGDALDCPLPPSACAAPSCDGALCPGLPWVVYYDSPACVNGTCAYQKKYFECDTSSVCSAGGCRFNGTLAASP